MLVAETGLYVISQRYESLIVFVQSISGCQTLLNCGTFGNTNFCHDTPLVLTLDSDTIRHIFLAFSEFSHYTDYVQNL